MDDLPHIGSEQVSMLGLKHLELVRLNKLLAAHRDGWRHGGEMPEGLGGKHSKPIYWPLHVTPGNQ